MDLFSSSVSSVRNYAETNMHMFRAVCEAVFSHTVSIGLNYHTFPKAGR